MNKSELVASIAESTNLTKEDAENALNGSLSAVEGALSKGEKVQLVGSGTFEIRQRKARGGRNSRNSEEVIKIPASKAPAFHTGKALKESVNK